MKIKRTEGYSANEIVQLVSEGAKFVIFPYTVSIVLMTMKRNSSIYFILPDEKSFKYSYGFVGVNLLVGWWGIPWGPIYTIGALFDQLAGGKDVTDAVLNEIIQSVPASQESSGYGINNQNNQTYNIPNNQTYNNPNDQIYNIPK